MQSSPKYILFFVIIILKSVLPREIEAQVTNKRWDLKCDNLGFVMWLNFSDMITKTSLPYYDPDINRTLFNIEVKSKVGISLGIITNIKISDNFDFRFIPTVAIQQRNYRYFYKDSVEDKKLEA